MPAPTELLSLIERFARNRDDYHKGKFNETQLRVDFLNPVFELLGWDMTNKSGHAEKYRDVIHEAQVKVGGMTKAPDYCFKIGPERKFFLEAKKPSVNIKDDTAPAFQLRRYAWSANLPLSVLTDFEEFAVYDCRIKPDRLDRASVARVMYFKFDELAEKWDEFAAIFSKDAVLKGSFDRYAESTKAKRGTAEVDDAFLAEIEGWRDMLARDIAKRNGALSQSDLNDAVQRTIDRIIFLRICEDRGIEEYGQLQALRNGVNVYPRLMQLFHKADARYNSGLFHFQNERGQAEAPDELTPDLVIDDKVLKEIFRRLYYPDSPYEFSVLSGSILGQVYEQFLGKVISLDAKHRATIEEKPEVRKAGGVYYTPEYIARYIVQNTVGKLVEGKTPKDVAKLRVLDPACGSGSFLLVAYAFLLDWHLQWYSDHNPEKLAAQKEPPIYQAPALPTSGDLFAPSTANWRLTTGEKKRILLNNIFGVDIDRQAVEVTKLSLLLKMLEGESDQSLGRQMKLMQDRVLPDLANNIKCGNSLIGSDFYDDPANLALDMETRRRINAFDWNSEFAGVMRAGGFDAVIGNPPYIRIQAMKEWAPIEVEFYKTAYKSASKGSYDIYVVFVELGLRLLNKDGLLGIILPSKFLATDYGEELRRLLSSRDSVSQIVDFRHEQVFESVSIYTCLLFLSAKPVHEVVYLDPTPPKKISENIRKELVLPIAALSAAPWVFVSAKSADLTTKIREASIPLLELPTRIARGSSTGADTVFVLTAGANGMMTRSGELVDVEIDILRKPLYATDFGRYRFDPLGSERVIFPYVVSTNGYSLIGERDLESDFPMTYKYLCSQREALERRKQYSHWYGFSAPRNLDVHDAAQMIVPLLADKGSYAVLPSTIDQYCIMASGGFSISVASTSQLLPMYVLGLLNSTLLFWVLRGISNVFRGGWITCTKQYVGTLPIRTIDRASPREIERHDQIALVVIQTLALHKQLSAAKTASDKTFIQRQIDQTDRQIDRLVYELYGLTDDEIRIVEESK